MKKKLSLDKELISTALDSLPLDGGWWSQQALCSLGCTLSCQQCPPLTADPAVCTTIISCPKDSV